MGSSLPLDSSELKINEFLKEIQLDYSSTGAIDNAIATIKHALNKIPDEKVTTNAAPGFIRDLGDDAGTADFTFRKPVSFEITGSYLIKSVAKHAFSIDILIRMPKECFYERDYLNHRYHAKRCLYLCVVKKHLKSCSVVRKIKWSTFQNEARKPILVIYPELKLPENSEFFLRIIPTATSLFTVSKLHVTRNNIHAINQGAVPQASPSYTSSILEDMLLEENAIFVKNIFLGWNELREALLLLKVWARHRTSIYTHDCLNGFLISVIVSYLTTDSGGTRISRSMQPIQIFRVTLDFIANSRLWDRGLSLQSEGQCEMLIQKKRQHMQYFGVVLLDVSGYFNLAFRMTKSAFLELRDEARWTLNCMDKCRDGGFEEVFMTKLDFPAKFDYCIRINLSGNSKVYAPGFCLDTDCWRLFEEKVHSLLDQGLNDRAKLIRVIWSSSPSEWNVEDGFLMFGNTPLLVGILASSFDTSSRVVDVGPSAENTEEVVKFRKFWGEKAELRRFKDGTIAESTVWECEQWERHLIMKRIVQYVLSRHLSISEEKICTVADQLDFCIRDGVRDPISFSGGLLGAFEVLSKRLRSLEDVPLRVSSVQPLASALRYTSVFPPEPHPLASEKDVGKRSQKLTTCVQAQEVMIQLEGSGNWPLDDVAVEKTKSAFLLKIGESLQNRWGMMCVAAEDEVNVLMDGYAFRLRILHERGMNLLKKQGNNQVKHIHSEDKELFFRSQHSGMVRGLQGRYPMYGPTVRLAKRWVTSHLFSAYLSEEAIELLVAYLFVNPFPFYAPGSRISGLLRFIRLLSEYDWTFSPLVVDINGDLSSKDQKEITENFLSSRKSYEESPQSVDSAMFLAASYDKASEAWTRFSPDTSVLGRIVSYARRGAEFLTNLVLQGETGPYRWESLFRTPLNNYDAVILLHRDKLPYPRRLLFPTEMSHGKSVIQGNASKEFHPYMAPGNLRGSFQEVRKKLMVNFDPTECFVEDLKREFPDTFKVWYDSLGGDTIGLTWEKPQLKTQKKRNREASDASQEATDLLKGVGEVGKGFVKRVYFLKAPRLQD